MFNDACCCALTLAHSWCVFQQVRQDLLVSFGCSLSTPRLHPKVCSPKVYKDEYRRDIDGGAYEREPVVMGSGGRLGRGAMRVINTLAKIAAESNGVEKHVFVRRMQEALSVARVQGNGWMCKKGLQAMAYGAVTASNLKRVMHCPLMMLAEACT